MRYSGKLTIPLVTAGAVLLVIVVVVRHQFSPAIPREREVLQNEYVAAATCAGCHADIARTYRQTAMGRSFYRPQPSAMVEDFAKRNTFYHRASDRYYEMFLKDGSYFQRRYQKDIDGAPTNIVEKRIDYVIGSGNHARSYLSRTSDNRLVELPVSWYTENGGYWAMSPGYERANHQDFRRAIQQDCMACHNAYPRADSPANRPHGEPVFGDHIPEGIDCQRCHGPGQAHVTAASKPNIDRESVRRAIVNPKRLSRDRQLEVCMQCHLETTSAPLPHMIGRFDRAPWSYVPGQPLGDYALFFDHAPGSGRDDKFEIAHAAYRLRKSQCFRSGNMGCTTCHNPHDVARGTTALAQYSAVCRTCHATAHAHQTAVRNATNCIDCHMPKRRTDDAVHVVMTDHLIQRRPPSESEQLAAREESGAAKPYQGEVVPYYPPGIPQIPSDELYIAVAQVQQGSNLASGIARLKAAIDKFSPTNPDFFYELGRAYARQGNAQKAMEAQQDALAHAPDFRPAQKELAASFLAAGRAAAAAELLDKSAGDDPVALTNLGNAWSQQGNMDRGRQTLRRAIAADPDNPEPHHLLGVIALRTGDGATGEKELREAIRLQPDLAEAQLNLGKLLAERGEYRRAEYHFDKAVGADPANARARQLHALAYVVLGAKDKATMELQEAVRLDPKFAVAHSDLADLYAAKGKLSEAVREYQLAIDANPNLPEAHYSLGVLLIRQGAAAQARPHFEKAAESSDAEVRAAAAAILRKLR